MPETTSIAIYGDEHGELFFRVDGETPGDVAHADGELIDHMRELIDYADRDGSTRYRIVITRAPDPADGEQ